MTGDFSAILGLFSCYIEDFYLVTLLQLQQLQQLCTTYYVVVHSWITEYILAIWHFPTPLPPFPFPSFFLPTNVGPLPSRIPKEDATSCIFLPLSLDLSLSPFPIHAHAQQLRSRRKKKRQSSSSLLDRCPSHVQHHLHGIGLSTSPSQLTHCRTVTPVRNRACAHSPTSP